MVFSNLSTGDNKKYPSIREGYSTIYILSVKKNHRQSQFSFALTTCFLVFSMQNGFIFNGSMLSILPGLADRILRRSKRMKNFTQVLSVHAAYS